jgi:hypothetical protein
MGWISSGGPATQDCAARLHRGRRSTKRPTATPAHGFVGQWHGGPWHQLGTLVQHSCWLSRGHALDASLRRWHSGTRPRPGGTPAVAAPAWQCGFEWREPRQRGGDGERHKNLTGE